MARPDPARLGPARPGTARHGGTMIGGAVRSRCTAAASPPRHRLANTAAAAAHTHTPAVQGPGLSTVGGEWTLRGVGGCAWGGRGWGGVSLLREELDSLEQPGIDSRRRRRGNWL